MLCRRWLILVFDAEFRFLVMFLLVWSHVMEMLDFMLRFFIIMYLDYGFCCMIVDYILFGEFCISFPLLMFVL